MNRLSDKWAGAIVSSDTLDTKDLIPKFCGVLREVDPIESDKLLREYRNLTPNQIGKGEDGFILDELINRLNDVAPDGCYFGTSEGDGACWMFLPIPPEEGE